MLIYNGQIIAGGGTIVLPMTRAEYEANKAILDSADVWVDLTDEPDDIATADQVAFWVGQTQKSVGYIGDIATKAIAKVEPTDTALYLHEVGTYFINKDGNICKVDSQIAIGGTIVLDANCHVLSDGVANDINSNKQNKLLSISVEATINAYSFVYTGLNDANSVPVYFDPASDSYDGEYSITGLYNGLSAIKVRSWSGSNVSSGTVKGTVYYYSK